MREWSREQVHSVRMLASQIFTCHNRVIDRKLPRNKKNLKKVYYYRVAQKSKPLPNDQKIVLKPVNEIRFIRQIKV